MSNDTITAKPSRKKSGFYHARSNRLGIGLQQCAELLAVDVDQVQQWDVTGHQLAERYLLLWDKKTINHPGWEGWTFSRGLLKYKGRQQFTGESILKSRFDDLELFHLRDMVKRLESENRLLRRSTGSGLILPVVMK